MGMVLMGTVGGERGTRAGYRQLSAVCSFVCIATEVSESRWGEA